MTVLTPSLKLKSKRSGSVGVCGVTEESGLLFNRAGVAEMLGC